MQALTLEGSGLSIEALVAAASKPCQFSIKPEARKRMEQSRRLVLQAIEKKIPVYGVTTGLGARATETLGAKTLAEFSVQTLKGRAHAIGPDDSAENVRAVMIVRLNTLLTGYSGADPAVADHLLDCLNAGLTPVVGSIGSVGAGDLILGASLGLALIGDGQMQDRMGKTGASNAMMLAQGIDPLVVGPRDGLALASNSCFVAAGAAVALQLAQTAYQSAQTAATLSMEAFRANLSTLNPQALAVKPLPGQQQAAKGLRQRLAGSQLFEGGQARRLQDPISIRNVPDIHGVVAAALEFARPVIEIEINSSSDNPLALASEGKIVSGGAYFTAELANAIETVSRAFTQLSIAQLGRISKHLNPEFSGLPTFLAKPDSGSNGFAPLMKVAEAQLSELLHDAQPVAVWPSINANGVEDCITSAPTAVRALASVARASSTLSAIELIVASQAVELRDVKVQLGPYLAKVFQSVRDISAELGEDRPLGGDVIALARAAQSGLFDITVDSVSVVAD